MVQNMIPKSWRAMKFYFTTVYQEIWVGLALTAYAYYRISYGGKLFRTRYPIPGGIQGQAGCGSGQPGLVVGGHAHSRGLKLDDHCGPFQPRTFYDSVIL
uniref:Uncharacterized protein n=1 Tax=Phasianus colchicus TaxID=9054 RepID=A0A669PE88_PHACC